MASYVLGFYFDDEMSQVLLIEKKKPEWQAGLLNGLGGKIEIGETPDAAMTREFEEECGLRVEGWKPLCIMSGKDWRVNVFYYVEQDSDKFESFQTKEDERVVCMNINDINSTYEENAISNVAWLVELCRDKELSNNSIYQVLIAFDKPIS